MIEHAGYRHCYIQSENSEGSSTYFALHGGYFEGMPGYGVVGATEFDRGEEEACSDWVNECDTDQCVVRESAKYPNPSVYGLIYSNSNTYVGSIARTCGLSRPPDLPAEATPGWHAWFTDGGKAAPYTP